MPLIAFALAAYLAGLLAGFSDSLLIGADRGCRCGDRSGMRAAAVAVCIRRTLHRRIRRRARRRPPRRSMRAPTRTVRPPLTLVLDDSASPGALLVVACRSCDVVRLAVRSTRRSRRGQHRRRHGEVSRTDRGIQMQHATVDAVARTGIAAGDWSAAAGRAIERTFRDDAPLVKALLIADRRDLSPEIRDRFAAAGLAHILAIAGLHIGIIAATIELALELFGVARATRVDR